MEDESVNGDDSRVEEEVGSEPPRKKAKKSKKNRRRVEVEPGDDEPETPRAGKEFVLLYKMLLKQNKELGARIDALKAETSSTTQACKHLIEIRKLEVGREESPVTTETLASPVHAVRDKEDRRQVLYSVTNLNNERPKFEGIGMKDRHGKVIHPVTFLEDLTSYLKKVPAHGRELDIVQECLIGQARDWSRIYKSRWSNFEDFKSDFLETFWGEVDQNKVRRDIVSNKWDRAKNPTMLAHFLSLAGQVNLLTFTIPEKQLVSDIMRHYPKSVQQLWAQTRHETILTATEFLRDMDMINQSEGEEFGKSDNQTELRVKRQGIEAQRYRKRYENDWRRPSQTTTPHRRGEVEVAKAPATTASAAMVAVDKENVPGSLN